MSDPNLQRADGCSIFATLIVALILLPAFYFIQKAIDAEAPPVATQDVTDERINKIKAYEAESGEFSNTINRFYSEQNSSLESVMQQVIDRYETNRTAP